MSTSKRRDWLDCTDDAYAEEFRKELVSLDLGQLRRYPSPRSGGLPVGHELQVFNRFVSGKDAVLLESAISGLYRKAAARRTRKLFEGLVLNRALPESDWSELLGKAVVSQWLGRELLAASQDGSLTCRFQAVPEDGFVVLTDPPSAAPDLRASGNAVSPIETKLNLHLKHHLRGERARSLEVGPGAGLSTLQLSRHHSQCEAVDINPRAVRAAAFNFRLNEASNCHVHCRDIFDASMNLGRFDTVIWNTPFIFLPEQFKETVVMAYGGDMGIELTLRFLDRLPALLGEDGVAYVRTAAPILENGRDYLLDELTRRPRNGQEIAYYREPSFRGARQHRALHKSRQIAHFQAVVLEVRRGDEAIREVGLGFTDGIVDRARRRLYALGLG
jgi:methylase of polypeptide subunit release factors